MRWCEKGCKRDEVEEDRTVGAEEISTSTARGAGMTVMVNSDKGMDNSIVVHIHLSTVCDPPFRNFQLTLHVLSLFRRPLTPGISLFWSFAAR